MSLKKYLTISFLIILASCNSEPSLERFEVKGYAIGDTIDDGISITEEVNES